MGYVDPIRLLPPHLQRYAEAVRAAGPFIPPRPAVPSDFIVAFDPGEGIGRQRARTVASIAEIVSRVAGISVIALLGERNFEHYMRARHVVKGSPIARPACRAAGSAACAANAITRRHAGR